MHRGVGRALHHFSTAASVRSERWTLLCGRPAACVRTPDGPESSHRWVGGGRRCSCLWVMWANTTLMTVSSSCCIPWFVFACWNKIVKLREEVVLCAYWFSGSARHTLTTLVRTGAPITPITPITPINKIPIPCPVCTFKHILSHKLFIYLLKRLIFYWLYFSLVLITSSFRPGQIISLLF